MAGSTIMVPIAEELFFRGFLVRRCIDADDDSVPVGRLADAIVAHATTNALLSGYVIATGSWTQWG